MKKLLRLLISQLILISSLLSQDIFHFDGYASFGVSTVLDGDITYKPFASQQDGVKKGDFNYKNQTVLGGKATINLTDDLSFVLQGDGRERNRDKEFFEAEWIYLKYYTPYDLNFRLGQFKFPLFHSSELTSVGYSRVWSRSAIPFYGIATYLNYRGLDATYNTYYNDYDIELQGSYGFSKQEGRKDANGVFIESEADDIKSIALKLSDENFWVRSVFLNTSSNAKRVHPNFTEELGEGDVTSYSFEFAVDLEEFRVEGGYIKGEIEKHVANESSQYLSLSYRYKEFTPYIIQSIRTIKPLNKTPSMPSNGGNPPNSENPPPPNGNNPPQNIRNTEITPINPSQKNKEESVLSLGVRYDIFENTAIKTQIDFFDNSTASGELIKSTTPDNANGTVLSIVVDMVF